MRELYRNVRRWFRKRRKRRRNAIIGAIVLGVLLLIAVAARPTSHWVKRWQARKLAKEAATLMENSQWQQAGRKALDALRLGPNEPMVMDSTAHLLSRTGQHRAAIEWWQKIEKTRPLTIPDRREYAAAALDSGELALASAQVTTLLGEKDPTPEDFVLAGQLETLRGRSQAALDFSERVLQNADAPVKSVFDAAVLTIANTTPESAGYGNAVDRLVQIARTDRSSVSLAAMRLLDSDAPPPRMSDPGSNPLVVQPPRYQKFKISRTEVADLLEKHPNAEVRDKLLAIQLRAEADRAHAPEFVQQAIDTYKNDDDAVPDLASWLYDRGEYQKILDIIPLERAARSRALLICRMDALNALGKFAELKEMLLPEYSVLDQVSQHIFLAIACDKLGEKVTATNEWQRALESATTIPKLQLLARYAEANNGIEIADKACIEILTQNPRLRSAYLARLRLAEANGNTAGAQKLASDITRLWPEDVATRIRGVYLGLLLNSSASDSAAAEREVDEVASSHSLGWNGRATLALAQLHNGRPAAALNVLEQPPLAKAPPPSVVVVHAKALDATGWKDKARKEAQQLVTARLLPEERAMIAPLLAD